jgi:Cu2+-exporting ATPase
MHEGDAPRGPRGAHEAHEAHERDARTPHDRSGPGEQAHHADHSGHEQMFRRRFWVCLILSLPVLIFSESLQGWLDYTAPTFTGSAWVTPVLAIVIFVYGGVPFLRMAWPEVLDRQPGMMTLISLAISVAFVYSIAALFIPDAEG